MEDALYNLIHSLGKGEKRYFKLYAGQNVKQAQSLHIDLFDQLDKMPTYDDAALLEWYGVARTLKNLPASKHQLRKLILKSLRAFGTGATPLTGLQAKIDEVKILLQKRLANQALKLARLSRKKAVAIEAHEICSILIVCEMDILHFQRAPNLIEQITALRLERDVLQAKMQAEQSLRDMYATVMAISTVRFRRADDAIEPELQRLMEHPLMKATPVSNLVALRQAAVRGLRALMDGRYNFAMDVFCVADVRWKFAPGFVLAHEEFYMQYQFNLLNSCLYAESPKDILHHLEKLKAQVSRLKGDLVKHQQKIYFIELLYVMNFGSGREAGLRVASILRWLDRNSSRVEPASLYFFHYNCAIFFFLRGEISESLVHINWILNFNPVEIRKDMKAFARLFQLVLHYERENTDFIEYRLRALKRKANHAFSPQGLERTLLVFFGELLRLPENETPEKFAELKAEIEVQVAAAEGRPPLGHMELGHWLDSRIQGRPIAEIYAETRA